MNLLICSLDQHWHDHNDYFVGGNMFLYYSAAQVKNKDFRGPDFFVVLDVDRTQDRKYWAIWEEGGKYPDVIIELMSDSTAAIDTGEKKQLYERTFKTADYFVYDPYAPQSLQGWHLGQDQRYHEIPSDSRGWLWSPTLDLWLGTWEGEINRESAVWLRFYDAEDNLVLLPEEAAQQQAEQARQQAEQAQQQAERAQQQAERAQQQAEQERLRAERLAEQLRSLGIDPAD
jgi:Uma2 family endonuclease